MPPKLPEDPQERLRVLQESFYMTLGSFFSGGTYDNVLLGLFSNHNRLMNRADESIKMLNKSIQQADHSSTLLTQALNRITLAGIIIAGLSLLVAAFSVGLDYWQYFHPTP